MNAIKNPVILFWGFRSAVFLIAVQVALVLGVACSSGLHKSAVSVADVVNHVAKKGDALYAVSVAQCHAAESVAAEIPDVTAAERLVLDIRVRCDEAFRALERVRLAVVALDVTVAKVEDGTVTAAELAEQGGHGAEAVR